MTNLAAKEPAKVKKLAANPKNLEAHAAGEPSIQADHGDK